MNLFGLSPGELILIMMIAMVVIGPEKLPETAASIGKWVREFRRVTTELTQQFSDENPFTEIQRAFSLTEITNSINAPLTPAEPTAATNSTPTPALDAVPVTTTPIAASAPTPIRSYYFDQPAVYVPVEDTWTHSGLDDNLERYGVGRKPITTDEVVDDWAHGVPLYVEPPAMIDIPAEDVVNAESGESEIPAEGTVAASTESPIKIESPAEDGVIPEGESVTPHSETSFLDDVETRVPTTMPIAGEPAPSEPVAVGAASSTDRRGT